MLPRLLRPAANCNFEVKRRNYLRLAGSFLMVPVLLAIVLFSTDPEGSAAVAWSLGACILVAGVGLRFWALGNIDGNKKRLLVTWGAYSRMRHPLYLGSFLILLAFCILAGSWLATGVAGLAFLVLYLPVIRIEEQLLAAQYGDRWGRYCQRSWAFLPRCWGRPAAAEPGEGEITPFRFRRPARVVGVLAAILVGVLGASAALRAMRSALGLPQLFF